MKGMIFTEFLSMVEEAHGLETADTIIAECESETDGAYTAVGNYDPAELVGMVVKLSEMTDTPVPDLLVAFGHRIHGLFVENYAHFFAHAKSTFDFIGSIEDYIHVEVRKLYPDAELPTFTYPENGENRIVLEYRSTRPLAHFALGLIEATIKYYGETIKVDVEDLSDGAGTAARFTLTRS